MQRYTKELRMENLTDLQSIMFIVIPILTFFIGMQFHKELTIGDKMKIIKAKYTEETLNWVSIEFDDGSIVMSSVKDGIRRQYTDVLQEYLDNGGVIEPQFTQEELDKIEQDKAIADARVYLNSTDWYVVRQVEEGIDVPAEVKTKRAEAKALLRG